MNETFFSSYQAELRVAGVKIRTYQDVVTGEWVSRVTANGRTVEHRTSQAILRSGRPEDGRDAAKKVLEELGCLNP